MGQHMLRGVALAWCLWLGMGVGVVLASCVRRRLPRLLLVGMAGVCAGPILCGWVPWSGCRGGVFVWVVLPSILARCEGFVLRGRGVARSPPLVATVALLCLVLSMWGCSLALRVPISWVLVVLVLWCGPVVPLGPLVSCVLVGSAWGFLSLRLSFGCGYSPFLGSGCVSLRPPGEHLILLTSRAGPRLCRFGFPGMGCVDGGLGSPPILARVGVVACLSLFVPLSRAPFGPQGGAVGWQCL